MKEIDNLFIEWKKEQISEPQESLKITMKNFKYIKQDSFSSDGIIDDEAYKKAKTKVLFISNEPNIDEHDAKNGKENPHYRDEYLEYYNTHYDSWKGKMRERVSALYCALTNGEKEKFYLHANEFAVMDLNKRGGPSKVDSIDRIIQYTKYYKDFIFKEISLINPDIIVWIGTNTYKKEVPEILGAYKENTNKYIKIDNKIIPIIKMWHTSYYQSRNTPLEGYENKIIGKQCAYLLEQYKNNCCKK